MIRTTAILLLLCATGPARAEEGVTCPTEMPKLKPSQRIEQLEQETLMCARDLRDAQKEGRNCSDALADKKRLSGLCETELSQSKEKLTLCDNRRLRLEEEARDRQKSLDGLNGRYELISTAVIIGLVIVIAVNILLIVGMLIIYRKYGKYLGLKKTR